MNYNGIKCTRQSASCIYFAITFNYAAKICGYIGISNRNKTVNQNFSWGSLIKRFRKNLGEKRSMF